MSGKAKRVRAGTTLGYDLNVESIPRQLFYRGQQNAEFGINLGSNRAENDNLKAIAQYIENQRPKINQYPPLLPIIRRFEEWYQKLGWADVHVYMDTTLNKARLFREEVNKALGQSIPATWIPADVNPDQHQPGTSAAILSTPVPEEKPPWIAKEYKIAAAVGAGVVGAVFVLKTALSFSPAGLARRLTSSAENLLSRR